MNTIAKGIVDQVTTQPDAQPSADLISQVMREMGRRGGLKGGKARAETLSKARRRQISSNAAIARWSRKAG